MQIYLFGLVLLGLVVLLGFIMVRTAAMVRQQRPLIAVGPIQWHGPVARTAHQPAAPQPVAAPAAEPGFGRAAAPEPAAAREPAQANDPPRERMRKLVSVSELEQHEADAELITAGYYRAVEARLEAAFEDFCGGTLDLAGYSALLDREYADALRAQTRLGPLADDTLHAEAADAIGALNWCRDWAREQAE
ncbi:hypothetical protein [Novosphingobium sp.]|uniref:hypothetical protein n=1 Tax=Novosphingobium sp. TaxID=1874826 RepID=UPI002736F176|nr:hypothetical protein [Novosphingobium sp.]MDP3906615.1 hypothetical protein [Novosphingobium sp.]